MTVPIISLPAGYVTGTAVAFANPDGSAQIVSAATPLPVTGAGGGGGGASLADQSVVDAAGVYWLVRDNGTTLSYLNWATGVVGSPATPVAPAGKLTGEQVRGTQYNATAAGTGYAVGDVLEHILILNIAVSPPTVLANAWVNLSQGTVLASSPAMANLAEITAVVSIAGMLPAFAATPTVNIGSSSLALETGGNLAGINTKLTAVAQDGSDGTGITAPAGGVGIRGWLSGIYARLSGTLAVSGTFWQATQPVSIASMPSTPVTGTFWPTTQPVSVAALPSLATGSNAIGSITNSSFGISGTLPAFAATPTFNIGTAPSLAIGSLPSLHAGGNPIGTVLVPETTFWNESTTALAASTTFTGTARDAGVAAGTPTANTYFNVFYFADQAGTASIECSNDNTTWRIAATVALAINTPAILSVPVMTRYHRAKLVNGAATQTALMINSSYTGS